MTATDTSPVSVASYFVNMYFVGCLRSVSKSGFLLTDGHGADGREGSKVVIR